MAELNEVSVAVPPTVGIDVLRQKFPLWRIVKALPFSGGPSATKWVYLALMGTIALVLLLLAMAEVGVYLFSRDHHSDAGLLSTIVAIVAVAQACGTLALNHRASLKAQSDSGSTVVTATGATDSK